jgi:predicted DNA-binding transcriptional regulator AlpA
MLLSYDDLKVMGVPHSPYNVRRMVRNGRFPKPIAGGRSPHLGPFRWDKRDVLAWLKKRKPSTRG